MKSRPLVGTYGGMNLKAPQPLMVALPRAKMKLPQPNPSRVVRPMRINPTTRLARKALVDLSSPAPHFSNALVFCRPHLYDLVS